MRPRLYAQILGCTLLLVSEGSRPSSDILAIRVDDASRFVLDHSSQSRASQARSGGASASSNSAVASSGGSDSELAELAKSSAGPAAAGQQGEGLSAASSGGPETASSLVGLTAGLANDVAEDGAEAGDGPKAENTSDVTGAQAQTGPLVRNESGIAAEFVAQLAQNNSRLEAELVRKERVIGTITRLLLEQQRNASAVTPGGFVMVPLGRGCCAFDVRKSTKQPDFNGTEEGCQQLCETDPACLAVELAAPTDPSAASPICHLIRGTGSISRVQCAADTAEKWCYIKWAVGSLVREAQAMRPVPPSAGGTASTASGTAVGSAAGALAAEAIRGVVSGPWKRAGTTTTPPGLRDRAKAMVVDAIQEIRSTLDIALGRVGRDEVVAPSQPAVSYMPKNHVVSNRADDLLQLLVSLAFNIIVLGGALVFWWYLRHLLPTVFCPQPPTQYERALAEFWKSAGPENDAALLEASGMDGLMLMKFFRMGLRLSLIVGGWNIFLLCPAHWLMARIPRFQRQSAQSPCPSGMEIADQKECWLAGEALLSEGEGKPNWTGSDCLLEGKVQELLCKDLPNNILDRLSIRSASAASANEPLLWLDTASVLIVTIATLYLLSRFLDQFSRRRRQYLLTTCARATVFVSRIPEGVTGNGLREYFEGLFPGRVLSATHILCPSSGSGATATAGEGMMVLGQPQYTPCGLVTFKTVRDAHHCAQLSLSSLLDAWKADLAPEPEELLWSNIFATAFPRWLRSRQVVAVVLLWLLFSFWFLPVGFVGSMADLAYLEEIPNAFFQEQVRNLRLYSPKFYETIQNNLSAASMTVFMSFLPLLLEWINGVYGFPMRRLLDNAVERQYFSFCLFYVLLVNAISQSLLRFLQAILLHPPDVFSKLAEALPQVSTWYMCYMTFTLSGLAIVMLRPYQLTGHFLCRLVWHEMPDHDFYTEMDESFGTMAARWTLYLSIALVYSSMMPLILPLSALAFGAALVVYKFQLLCVQRAEYDTGGLWVPIAASNLQFVLGVYQVTMLGILQGNRKGMAAIIQALCIIFAMAANIAFYRYAKRAFNYEFLPLDAAADVPDSAQPLAIYEPPSKLSACEPNDRG